MGLTSALNTSLNGLTLNETTIDVLGNNIANAGTNGFKASRVLFSTQLARTLSVGSRPTDTNGGTLPRQVGLGATTASIEVDFSSGGLSNSTSPSDLAIQGDGFFVVNGAKGNLYTRNGNFSLNSKSELTNAQGLVLQGYGVDENYDLVTTRLQDIKIPLGDLQVAAATRNVSIGGALFPGGNIGSHGTLLQSAALVDGTATAVTGSTLLSDVRLASAPGTALFTSGTDISLTAVKGGTNKPTATFSVTSTTTLNDYTAFLSDAYGLQSTGTVDNPMPVDADGIAVGASITGGKIQLKGNRGTVNDIDLPAGALTGPAGAIQLGLGVVGARADGESSSTPFVVYDSLGQEVQVQMTAVLESQDNTGTTFRYFVESDTDSDPNLAIGNSIIKFDNNGKVVSTPDNTFSVDRTGTAAVTPLQVTFDMKQISGISSANAGSSLKLVTQDGSAPGTLTSFVIDESGLVNGIFDNGVIRNFGQIVLARFTNPKGLLQQGLDTYSEGVASGLPTIAAAGTFGTGSIRAGTIELSNTDIGRNLVDLIVASTNYRGNARVIGSVQQLVDELLVLGR